jgi:hypothetical protein
MGAERVERRRRLLALDLIASLLLCIAVRELERGENPRWGKPAQTLKPYKSASLPPTLQTQGAANTRDCCLGRSFGCEHA